MDNNIQINEYNNPISSIKRARKITIDLLLSSVSLTRYSRESAENYLKRVTHLHLQGKKIALIRNLDACPNLKVLYLYDNQIERINNLDFAIHLEQLYLNNNQIKELPELKLENLRKLHLENNDITFVVGLDACEKLTDLYVANQRLPSFTPLEFDHVSLQAISRSLQVLDVSGNSITLLNQFMVLTHLRIFVAERNAVSEIDEVEMILSLSYLEEVSLVGNPVCSLPRYYDHVMASSGNSLLTFDHKPVQPHQQIAIHGLKKHREALTFLQP